MAVLRGKHRRTDAMLEGGKMKKLDWVCVLSLMAITAIGSTILCDFFNAREEICIEQKEVCEWVRAECKDGHLRNTVCLENKHFFEEIAGGLLGIENSTQLKQKVCHQVCTKKIMARLVTEN